MSEETTQYPEYFRLYQGLASRPGFIQFLSAISELYNQGYEIHNDVSNGLAATLSPFSVIMKKKGLVGEIDVGIVNSTKFISNAIKIPVVAKEPEPTKEEILSGLKSKEELVKFASDNAIEIPEDVKIPSAIKKYLLEAVKPAEQPPVE